MEVTQVHSRRANPMGQFLDSCQPCEGAPCVLVFADSAGIAGSALRVAWIIVQIGRL